MSAKPKLYLTPTPIGNYDDITLRALNVLRESDFIICEELKPARRLLAHFEIEKELFQLNEHNEKESAPLIIEKLKKAQSAALISDGGTPLFSDPGHYLVDLCLKTDIEVVPLPGASSIMPALIASNLDFEKFYYFGWLSPKKEIRRRELKNLRSINELIVILDTPYRLKALLSDIAKVFGENQKIVLAYKLTMDEERFFRGAAGKILNEAEIKNLKGEFVLLIDNAHLVHSKS
jgi:16S rRNA (cytidine1402-2'-O)-methyltransferase